MLALDLPTFPVLTTKRMVLRQLRASDAERMFAMRSDPVVMEHVNRPMARTVEDATALIDRINGLIADGESLHWAMTLKGEDAFMGLIGIWRLVKEHHYGELGYTMMKEYWGQGYASEAIASVVELAFQLGLHRVEAITRPGNLASMRVLEKNGFVREGYLRHNILWNGAFHDSVHFGRVVDPAP
ncbi:MAG TPA: GNAT family N-acetyltransferase [Flavobacteriales bacterium]